MGKRAWPRVGRMAGVGLAAAILASGCGQATNGATSSVVPWLDRSAPNIAQAFTIGQVPPCTAADLAADISAEPSYIGGGPVNASTWRVTVTDKGSKPCYVGSTVDVTFSTSGGPLQIAAERVRGDIVYLTPPSQGELAGFSLRAVGEIDTFPCVVPAITQMQVSPAAGLGSVTVKPGPAGGVGTPCPSGAMTYLAELYSDQPAMGYAAATQTAIEAPAVAHPGQKVRFTITMTNWPVPHSEIGGTPEPSPTPMSFNPCPTYHEELEGLPGTFHTNRLNCGAANPIQAHGSETFEMYVTVPVAVRPGPTVLVWSLDGSPQTYQTARINLEITA